MKVLGIIYLTSFYENHVKPAVKIVGGWSLCQKHVKEHADDLAAIKRDEDRGAEIEHRYMTAIENGEA